MIAPQERAKSTLRAVIQFGKARDRWPDLSEIRAFRKRLGCRATIYVALQRLRDAGLVELRGHCTTARWAPTLPGFDLLHTPPFVPALELQRTRKDAASLLAVQNIPRATSHQAEATLERFTTALPIYE